MASIASQPTTTIEQLEAAGFTVRRRDEVNAVIARHPYVVPLLLEAHEVIARYFDLTDPVVLTYVEDPEAESDDSGLYAYIPLKASYEEARRRLRRFDEEWWLEAQDRANDTLVIDVSRSGE